MIHPRLHTPFNMAGGAVWSGVVSTAIGFPEMTYASMAFGAAAAGLISAWINHVIRQESRHSPALIAQDPATGKKVEYSATDEEASVMRTVGYMAICPIVTMGALALPNILKLSGWSP